MNIAIWIIQGVLAAFFLMPAFMKLTTSKQKLIEQKRISSDGSALFTRFVGVAELLGSIGIIVPLLVGILPILTPLAALGFCAVMIGAFIVHYKKQEFKQLPLIVVLFILSGVVAYYRF